MTAEELTARVEAIEAKVEAIFSIMEAVAGETCEEIRQRQQPQRHLHLVR